MNNEQLSLIANILQVINYIENSRQTSNDLILNELQNQNKFYLEEILNKLERLEKNAQLNGSRQNI